VTTTAVGEILELSYGKALKEADRSGGVIPVVGSGGIVGAHSTGITDAPTIVVGRKGSIGSVTWVDGSAWPIDTAYFIKLKRKDVAPRWTYWMLKTLRLETMNKSAAVPGLNRDDVYRLRVALPPLQEQRRIAAILDHADALRAKRRQVLAQFDSLTRSIYVDMFEGRQWPSKPLVELADSPEDIRCGPFGTQLNVSEFRPSGVPLLGIKNVNAKFSLPPFEFLDEPTAERLSRYDLRPGDLVMTRKGTIGNCAIYPASLPAGVMHSDLLRARIPASAADSVFLEHHLQLSPRISHQIKMMSPGAIMPGINVTKLKQLAVDTPPLSLQREFADHLKVVDRQRDRAEISLDASEELFTSLQARAFRGGL
jgi:type I restriction enzyme S subunit